MDENLERLAREAASDPADAAAARRLDTALARAGREEELRERFRFKFECPRQWQDLETTRSAKAKFCDECQRKVFAVPDVATLREHVSKGDCVAVPSSLLATAFSELPKDPRFHSAKLPGTPCVVPGGAVPGAVPEDVRSLLWRRIAQTHGLVPIAATDEKLVLAVTLRYAATQLRNLGIVRGREVETVLVSEEELTKLIAALPESPPMLMGKVTPE